MFIAGSAEIEVDGNPAITFEASIIEVIIVSRGGTVGKVSSRAALRHPYVLAANSDVKRVRSSANIGLFWPTIISGAGVTRRVQSSASLTLVMRKRRVYYAEPALVSVNGNALDLEIEAPTRINSRSNTKRVQSLAFIYHPNYLNATANVRKTQSNGYAVVTTAINGGATVKRVRSQAYVFIPPYAVSGASTAKRAQSVSLVHIPTILIAEGRTKRVRSYAVVIAEQDITSISTTKRVMSSAFIDLWSISTRRRRVYTNVIST